METNLYGTYDEQVAKDRASEKLKSKGCEPKTCNGIHVFDLGSGTACVNCEVHGAKVMVAY